MLVAEIIAIGSELLTPEKVDSNGPWLTRELNDVGIDVKMRFTVGDDGTRLEEAVRDALKRSDIVITTGGLGPTEDDITREFTARATGRELIYHDEIESHLRERFKAWGREMPEINKRQAFVIEGASVLPNPNGSAVGMYLEIEGKVLTVLPGPPRENQPMFLEHVLPRLKTKAGVVHVSRRLLRVSGMGESAVDEVAAPIYTAYPHVETSILFNKSEVEIHLAARGDSADEAVRATDEIVEKLSKAFGVAMFTMSGETLEQVVGRMLAERDETLALAESCTGGLIGSRITDVPGSSAYFIEGAITYANEAKVRMLGVDPELLKEHGAVSAECAEAMAAGIRERAGAHHAISVTGVAGPGGGSEEKPVGLVFIGYSGARGTRSFRIILPGDRYLVRWRASQAALDYLRRQLLKAENEKEP